MGAIKREPTPRGPITDLFDRLDGLHSRAGRPSMREIAKRAGRGNVSSSTVHNVFRSSRVPRWDFLQQVVSALGGADDLEEYLTLWQAAERAENDGTAPRNGSSDAGSTQGQYSAPLPQSPQGALPHGSNGWSETAPRLSQRILSPEIPAPNDHFTGRVAVLDALSQNLSHGESPHVQVVSGMGGIGKTEIATEYIRRNGDRYEIIWWIRAEHHDRVRDALVKLAQRLELRQATPDSSRDRTIAAVLEELQSETRPSWLLVYDNAVNPLELQKYLPATRPRGHVIVTSRQPNWPSYIVADGIEVAPFTEQEAVDFLRGRVLGLAAQEQLTQEENAHRAGEARRLAAELGHLPIAIEHAGAYLAVTRQSVDEYLTRFAENADQLLSLQPADSEFPAPVSRTWAISRTLLTPDAEHLFNLCAFFSPEPISAELFLQDTKGLDGPPDLADFLASPRRFRVAVMQLHRLSLVKVDGAHDHIEMHRVVQAVTQGRLQHNRIDTFNEYRAAVDALLAKSNPRNPDHSSSDVAYDLSLQHLESDHRFLHTDNPALRDLFIDQVRRLHLRGAHLEAAQFGQEVLRVWRERLGEEDLQVLAVAVEVAVALYIGGRAADAHELILRIRPLLQRYTEGHGFKVLLLCENFYGEDLRAHSQFSEALELDVSNLPKYEAIFGVTHERTLNLRNNVAIDYRQLGRFEEALETDSRTLADRRDVLGPHDILTLHSQDAVARDLRSLGRYQESLDMARKVVNAFEVAGVRDHPHLLQAREGFATALRKAGHHWNALRESEHVLDRYRRYLGFDHMHTLRAATSLINDRRAVGDLAGAEKLASDTRDRCLNSDRPDDLYYAALVNLASVLRIAGRPGEALTHDERARKGLIKIYGDQHPHVLAVNINYASDLAACGKLGDAIQLGQETLVKCRDMLGPEHPHTLMSAANLSIDEFAAGDQAGAERRLAAVLLSYENTLTLEHPEARAAAQRTRLTAEIEPCV